MAKMFRLLIVDDEHLICELIKNLIHFEELGIELIGQANDAVTALEMIGELKPDIVVTDIRMPEMDGLEIIRRTNEAGLDVKFVIISGHKQWDYAFGAIKYGVEDYLLKPINEQELNSALMNICRKKAQETERSWQAEALESNLADSRKQIRVHFTESLLRGEEQGQDIEYINRRYGFHFVPGVFFAAAVIADFFKESGDRDVLGRGNMLEKLSDGHLLEYVREAGAAECECCMLGGGLVLLVNCSEEKGRDLSWMNHVCQRLGQETDVYDCFGITLCVGKASTEIMQAAHSLSCAQALAANRACAGMGSVLYWESRMMEPDKVRRWAARQMQNGLRGRILTACSIASSVKLRECLNDFYDAMKRDELCPGGGVTRLPFGSLSAHLRLLRWSVSTIRTPSL